MGLVVQTNSNPKCQDLSKSPFWMGVLDQLKPKVPRSVQICIFGVCGKGGGWFRPTQTQSAKICPNLNFQGRGCSWEGGGGSDQHS